MKHISRRDFIHSGCAIAAASLVPSAIEQARAGLIHRGGGTGFNGGLKQTGNPNTSAPGMYIFINFIKGAAPLLWNSIPTDPTYSPFGKEVFTPVDANGYPTSIPTGAVDFNTNFTIPNATQYAGKWVLKWDGSATAGMRNFSFTAGPGFSGNSSTTGRFEFFNNDTNAQWTSAEFFCNVTAASPNHLKNLRLCRSIDEAAMDAGQLVFPDHLTLMRSAKPGAIRSLGWGGESDGTNTSLIGLWSQRRPVGYVNYRSHYYNPNFYGGVTTHSGTDYSLTYAGFTLTDKAIIHLVWDAGAPNRQSQNATVAWSTTNGNPIVANRTGHGLAVGNTVCFGNSGLPAGINVGQQYFVSNVIDANNFNISATSGGASINATATTSGSWTIAQMPRLSINSGAFINLTDFQTPNPSNIGSICGVSPSAGLSTIIYDQTTNWWHVSRTGGALMVGGPPEIFVDYCAAIGANPWMTAPFMTQTTGGALGGCTDYMPSWVTYAKNTYSWMKPVVEPYNESWNTTLACLGTFYATTLAFALWPAQAASSFAISETYGKWVSDLGQAISAIYGNDRTKYSMISMGQAVTFHTAASLNINDSRLTSALYVSVSGGQAAYKFCDRVGAACYFNPQETDTIQEIIDAFNYSVTNAGNTAAQSVIAEAFAATANSGVDTFVTLAFVKTLEGNIKNWGLGLNGTSTVPNAAGGNTVKGMCMYEGGYGPDVPPDGSDASTSVALTAGAIIQANPCVVTLTNSTTTADGVGVTGNPAVVGMMVNIQFVSGMTQLNNSTVDCTFTNTSASIAATNTLIANQAVMFLNAPPTPFLINVPYHVLSTGLSGAAFQLSATKAGSAIVATANGTSNGAQNGWFVSAVGASTVSLDVDSTGFTAWTNASQAKVNYTGTKAYTGTLRIAGSRTAAMGVCNTQMYTDFFSFGGGGFTAEYPSNFIYFGNAGSWAVLNPNIYAPFTAQWNSIVAQQ